MDADLDLDKLSIEELIEEYSKLLEELAKRSLPADANCVKGRK